ncbi:MAG TPA: hypothetical protein VG456_05240 [Candidatus Sulfopaludibacter sp.]|nr:hypothetical protein [Candidatus Sulfopaludibacter sp.]
METRAGTFTLAHFRAKTDHQLHALIASRLERGLFHARVLLDPEVRQRWASMDEFTNQAESAYNDVARLLPLLRGIPASERLRLESRLIQLREILDCAIICTETPRVHAAAML